MTKHRPVAPARMAHFVLQTRDAGRLIAWYQTVLSCEIVTRGERIDFLTFDDEHHRIAIAENPDLEPRNGNTVGVNHIAFTFDHLDQLLDTYQRLKAEGIVPHWCVNHGMSTSMYYRDPDGNRIELQIDNYDSPEENKAIFRSEAFAGNNYGNRFVPEDLIAARAAGKSVAELVRLPIGEPEPV